MLWVARDQTSPYSYGGCGDYALFTRKPHLSEEGLWGTLDSATETWTCPPRYWPNNSSIRLAPGDGPVKVKIVEADGGKESKP